MRPLATILLDTPESAGPVRGVIAWLPDEQTIRVYDPRTDEPADGDDPSATDIPTLDDALQAVADLYRFDEWELSWFVEDPEDYDPEPTR